MSRAITVGECYSRYGDEMLKCLREIERTAGAICYEFQVVCLGGVHSDEVTVFKASLFNKAGDHNLADTLRPVGEREYADHCEKALAICKTSLMP